VAPDNVAVTSPGGKLVGRRGPGAFDSDDALDLLGTLAEQDAVHRRQTLEEILRRTSDHLRDMSWRKGPSEIVAAAAIVAAWLPPGEAIAREITSRGYDTAAIVVPEALTLADDAFAALLIAAGHDARAPRDGAWHHGWADSQTALQARRTTDELAAVFYRYQHRHDKELPLEWGDARPSQSASSPLTPRAPGR